MTGRLMPLLAGMMLPLAISCHPRPMMPRFQPHILLTLTLPPPPPLIYGWMLPAAPRRVPLPLALTRQFPSRDQDGAEMAAPIPAVDAPASDSTLPPSANSATDADAGAASPVAATRTRKGRGKHNHRAKDERKRQRHAAFLLTLRDNTEAGT